METAGGSVVSVFAYGSNMCTARIRERVPSATPLTTGYVSQRRLTFHKRGNDGSAKADAAHTGCVGDRIWGVVFSLKRVEKTILDDYELGYDDDEAIVVAGRSELSANIYVARPETIDTSIKPFVWYHRFVIHGAIQHRLPTDYLKKLHAIEAAADPNFERTLRNSRLLG